MNLCRFMKSLQGLDGICHRLRRDHSCFKYTFTSPGYLTVFVQRLKSVLLHRRNRKPTRIRADIDRCESWHLTLNPFSPGLSPSKQDTWMPFASHETHINPCILR